MGQQAMGMMLSLIKPAQDSAGEPADIVVQGKLIVRASTVAG
jgi:DNA-binding LacI/PurR family transcriptional regulator